MLLSCPRHVSSRNGKVSLPGPIHLHLNILNILNIKHQPGNKQLLLNNIRPLCLLRGSQCQMRNQSFQLCHIITMCLLALLDLSFQ